MKPKWAPTFILIHWLNGERLPGFSHLGKGDKESRSRVAGLVRDISAAQSLVTHRFAPGYARGPVFEYHTHEFSSLIERIEGVLADYPMNHAVSWDGNDEEAKLYLYQYTVGTRPQGEQLAVENIMSLAKGEHLQRVRQCGCSRWFMATRADQRACSATCRHKTYEQTDAFKAKRRKYMRDYYALKQSGKVK